MSNCQNCPKTTLDQDVLNFIQDCLKKENPESYLIAVLHKIQGKYGYLSQIHMEEVAHLLGVPTSSVSGVATFYHYFRLRPRGRFSISVCQGTACFVKGADQVVEAFQSELGIKMGETTTDGLFSLENTRCVGVCAMAPVVMVNEEVFSGVSPKQVPEIINRVKSRQALESKTLNV